MVRTTLLSLASLSVPDHVTISVNVIDNTTDGALSGVVNDLSPSLPYPLRLVFAPHRNISIARNAALDSCGDRFLCFIDDDEMARTDWLARLHDQVPGHDAVFGPALARPSDGRVPWWMGPNDFHSDLILPNDPGWKGMSCNVMLDMEFVRANGLRFREDLGQTGGEDTLFFLSAFLKGARFGYAPLAIVDAPVAPARMRLPWLLRRRFRNGQVHAIALRELGSLRGRIPISVAKALASLVFFVGNSVRPHRAVPHLLRLAFHVGVISRLLGAGVYREYAPTRLT